MWLFYSKEKKFTQVFCQKLVVGIPEIHILIRKIRISPLHKNPERHIQPHLIRVVLIRAGFKAVTELLLLS